MDWFYKSVLHAAKISKIANAIEKNSNKFYSTLIILISEYSSKLFILISCASLANRLFKIIKLFIRISCIVQWIC